MKSLHFAEGDDGHGLLATGDCDGRTWKLRRIDKGGRGLALTFSCDGDAGMIDVDAAHELQLGVTTVGSRRLVWGLAPAATVAVRVLDDQGAARVGPTVGAEIGGSGAFVVALDEHALPVSTSALDRDGQIVAAMTMTPPATPVPADVGHRIEVRAVNVDGGRGLGTIIGEGGVGESTWRFAVAALGGDLHTTFATTSARGGGSGSGSGPFPQPRAGHRIGLKGSGISGSSWHLDGWIDLSITRLALHLRSGELVPLPILGRDLGWDVAFFAVGLPLAARALSVECYDDAGDVVDRCWLGGTMERALDENAERLDRAHAPAPDSVHRLWHDITGTDLVDDEAQHVEMEINPFDLALRWPLRPLLVPGWLPAALGERWTVTGQRVRWPMSQSCGLSLRVVLGLGPEAPSMNDLERLQGGAVVIHQGVWWADPPGHRDPPNAEVRGFPARIDEHTMERNNFDEINVSWIEPASVELPAPFSGIAVSVQVSPRAYTREVALRIAAELHQAVLPTTD